MPRGRCRWTSELQRPDAEPIKIIMNELNRAATHSKRLHQPKHHAWLQRPQHHHVRPARVERLANRSIGDRATVAPRRPRKEKSYQGFRGTRIRKLMHEVNTNPFSKKGRYRSPPKLFDFVHACSLCTISCGVRRESGDDPHTGRLVC
jgi:hypothetical protein